jgi:hypothetical protein
MKERREAGGARRKASGANTGPARVSHPAAGDRGLGTDARTKAAPLIAAEDLRPLPPAGQTPKRKQCPDCRYCQGCSQDRCRLCRTKKKPGAGKLSLAEQIALYEKINRLPRKKAGPRNRNRI